jgi:hypothetical protein
VLQKGAPVDTLLSTSDLARKAFQGHNTQAYFVSWLLLEHQESIYRNEPERYSNSLALSFKLSYNGWQRQNTLFYLASSSVKEKKSFNRFPPMANFIKLF